MPETLASLTDWAATWLLTYLLHSTATLLPTWLAARRLGPAGRAWLWRAAVLAPGLTAGVVLVVGIPAGDVTMVMARVEVLTVGHASPSDLRPERLGAAHEGVRASIREVAVTRGLDGTAAGHGPIRWPAALVAIWLIGGVAMLGRALGALRALRAVHRGMVPASPRMETLLCSLAAKKGWPGRPARVRCSEAVTSPCALPGGWIVVPVRADADLSDAESRAVLAHELAHVERRDPEWSIVMRLACAVLWPQPFVRGAVRAWAEASERAADEAALARVRDPLGLARAIERVAGWLAGPGATAGAVSMAGWTDGGPADRVRRILGHRPIVPERRWPPFVIAAGLVALALALPSPRVVAPARGTFLLEEIRVARVSPVDGASVRDGDAASGGVVAPESDRERDVVYRIVPGS